MAAVVFAAAGVLLPVPGAAASGDPGASRDSAAELGDITGLVSPRFPKFDLDLDGGDAVHWFSFSLSESRKAFLGLRQLDADADLFLEDEAGTLLAESRSAGTADEKIRLDLGAGTYYVEVRAVGSGANRYALRHGTSDPAAGFDPGPDSTDGPDSVDESGSGEPVVVEDADSACAGAVDLGDITAVTKMRYPTYEIDGDADAVDWFSFTIAEHRFVSVGVRQLDAAVRLTLTDSGGSEIGSKSSGAKSHAMFYGTRLAGTYCLKVEAAETAANRYRLAHSTKTPKQSKLEQLLDQQQTLVAEPQRTAEGADDGDSSAVGQSDTTVTISDAGLRAVVETALDKAAGASITTDDMATLTALDASSSLVRSISGLEHAVNLTSLNLADNNLSGAVDVSAFTKLTDLALWHNSITSIAGLDKLTLLQRLLLDGNRISSLDVSKNTALVRLRAGSNSLQALDVSANTALQRLLLDGNRISSLDVSKNTELTHLRLRRTRLTSLDVSKNTELVSLSAYESRIASSVDLSNNTKLTWVDLDDNRITSVDVSGLTVVRTLLLSGNRLTSIDVSDLEKVEMLGLECNNIASFSFSGLDALVYLMPRGNPFVTVGFVEAWPEGVTWQQTGRC